MKRLAALFLGAGVLVLWNGPASAMVKPFQIGVGGGVSVPLNDAADALKNGWHASGIFRWNLYGLPLDLRGSFNYTRLPFDQLTTGYDGTGRILSGLGNVSFHLGILKPIQPYITAGLGAFNLKGEPESSTVSAPAAQTKFGIDAGAGIQFAMMGAHGFLEGKFQNVYTDQGFNQALTHDLKTQIVHVTFGVFF